MRGIQDVETSAIDSGLNFTPRQVVPTFFSTQKSKILDLKSRNPGDKKTRPTKRKHSGLLTEWFQTKQNPQFHCNEPWYMKTKIWPTKPFYQFYPSEPEATSCVRGTPVRRTCCALTRLSKFSPCSDSWNAAIEHTYDVITSESDVITSGFDVITSDYDVITLGYDIITSGYDIITLGYNIITSSMTSCGLWHHNIVNDIISSSMTSCKWYCSSLWKLSPMYWAIFLGGFCPSM